MMHRSVGIAGCGVAGLSCAIFLALRGWRVVVFDRMDVPSPLGSGLILQPVGLAVLDALGQGDAIRSLGAPITRLFGKVEPSGRTVLDVRYRARGAVAPIGLAVHRGALFSVLYDAAVASGVVFEMGKDVAGCDGSGRLLFGDGTSSASFDLVIDAMGVWSPLSRAPETLLPYGALWASLDWPDESGLTGDILEQRYKRARNMVGVLPIGRLPGATQDQAAFFWSLKHDDHAAWLERGLGAWKDEVLALWPEVAPLVEQISSREQLVFAAYAHRTLRSPIGRGVVHVGDSWHCASPQLGQGANMAMLDALALVRALEVHRDVGDAVASYAHMRLWHIRLYQAMSWMFTPAYQSDSGFFSAMRDHILGPVSGIWPVPSFLAGMVAGELGMPMAAISRHGESDMGDRGLSSAADAH